MKRICAVFMMIVGDVEHGLVEMTIRKVTPISKHEPESQAIISKVQICKTSFQR